MGRRGVTQFRQAHYLQPPVGHLLDSHLPDVKEALLRACCVTFDLLATMPRSITDRTPREGDEQFITITGRRPTIEYAVASVAERLIPVRRGVSVVGLLTGPSAAKGIPHVTGVRTMDGEEVPADLIVDAIGRRSRLPNWLEAIGARRPIEEAEDSGFIYYTRFFRSTTGVVPSCRAALQTYYHSFSVLTLPGDAGTWSVTLFISSGDQALKKLRDLKHWMALVAACPLYAHWLDGEPITDVLPMGGTVDRYRRFVVDGVPVATGIVQCRRFVGLHEPVARARDRHGTHARPRHGRGRTTTPGQPTRAHARTGLHDRDASDALTKVFTNERMCIEMSRIMRIFSREESRSS